ncbi:hypothetical protein HZA42_01110 [Candidatus Peregrinibacteria bacterium]|nr:hypothetical protein [Candidatus Peregrinibacteria bacterium]
MSEVVILIMLAKRMCSFSRPRQGEFEITADLIFANEASVSLLREVTDLIAAHFYFHPRAVLSSPSTRRAVESRASDTAAGLARIAEGLPASSSFMALKWF